MKNILAIVGMCGAGKSVVCDYLEELGYKKLYFGGITLKVMKEEGLEITPDNEKRTREKLREEHGPECYAKFLYPEIEEESKINNNIVLDGLYSWYEYKYLKEKLGNNLKMIAIVCDKPLRYERIAIRPERPFDNIKARERDISEIENLYKGGPISYADYYILNNYTKEDIRVRVDEILNEINKTGEN